MMRTFQIIAAGAMIAAAPAASVRTAHAAKAHHDTVTASNDTDTRNEPVPGIVLIGMAVAGLTIVGVSARRRQPGRSVTD